jgi:hypothetical protein
MQTAIISGLFAFLGALIALYAQRRTMQESWLLQRRAESFAKFLAVLESFVIAASSKTRDGYSSERKTDKMYEFMEIANSVWIESKVVLLYIARNDKPVFRELVESIVFNDYFIDGKESKHPREFIDKIEVIFEKNLLKLKL